MTAFILQSSLRNSALGPKNVLSADCSENIFTARLKNRISFFFSFIFFFFVLNELLLALNLSLALMWRFGESTHQFLLGI